MWVACFIWMTHNNVCTLYFISWVENEGLWVLFSWCSVAESSLPQLPKHLEQVSTDSIKQKRESIQQSWKILTFQRPRWEPVLISRGRKGLVELNNYYFSKALGEKLCLFHEVEKMPFNRAERLLYFKGPWWELSVSDCALAERESNRITVRVLIISFTQWGGGRLQFPYAGVSTAVVEIRHATRDMVMTCYNWCIESKHVHDALKM